MNKAILIGNLGKDPEMKTFDNGTKVAFFTMATTETYKDSSGERKQLTEWHNVKAWNNKAELVDKYLKKGDKVAIEGKIETRAFDGEDGVKRYMTEINLQNLTFLTAKNSAPAPQPAATGFEGNDDLPF